MSEVKSSAPIRTILRERKRAFGGSERVEKASASTSEN